MARERVTDTSALVAAAARVFVEKGYGKATIDDIAEAARISRPTVYQYVKSKQHLLDLMVEQVTTDLGRRLDADLEMSDSSEMSIRIVVTSRIHSVLSNPTLHAIIYSEQAELSQESRQLFRSWAHARTQTFAGVFAAYLAEFPNEHVDPTVTANLIDSMLTNLFRWYDPAGPVSPAELADHVMVMIRGVLEPSDAGRAWDEHHPLRK